LVLEITLDLDQQRPEIDPAPNSNTEKDLDDWVSGDEPMTGAQSPYLKTLSEECDEPGAFAPDLTKAEASKGIDALKAKRRHSGGGSTFLPKKGVTRRAPGGPSYPLLEVIARQTVDHSRESRARKGGLPPGAPGA
jgi:Protein of unknown function (DUF3072)